MKKLDEKDINYRKMKSENRLYDKIRLSPVLLKIKSERDDCKVE